MGKNVVYLIIYFALTISFLRTVNPTLSRAQVPQPYVRCGETKDDEFHSLRPYQASPCTIPINMDEQSVVCGNDYQINDTVIVPQDWWPPEYCNPNPPPCNGTAMCHFVVPRKFGISINSYNSEYPIAGNTELVPGGETQKKSAIDIRLEDYKIPPDINQYTKGEFAEYYRDIRRWRGDSCAMVRIPIINKKILLCFDNPLNPNFDAELFPNIPYSSTEDRIGKLHSTDMIWDPDKSSVERISPDPPNTEWNAKPRDERNQNTLDQESVLYFPHMEENVELSTLTQSTYLPKELLEEEQPVGDIVPLTIPNEECKLVEVRYNPGDQLFGETMGQTGVPNAEVSYRAIFNCECTFRNCHVVDCCTRVATFHTDIDVYTPMIEELFSKTVAGNASIFKKIFPKMESGAPVEEIEDIPGVSDVVHTKWDIQSRTQLLSKEPEFYFPHLGSIYDYFLKDIQTALRPKDFPSEPLGLTKNKPILSPATLNEYVSWFFNGSEYRAENDLLSASDPTDIKKITTLTGPVNKLLSQNSQWRNIANIESVSYSENEIGLGKVDQIEKAGNTRHNQIAGCVIGVKIPIIGTIIGGIPTACLSESQKNLPTGSSSDPDETPPPDSGMCPQVPDSAIPTTYRNLKDNFIRLADQWAGEECNLAEECYNYVVNQSKNQGVNPALSLAIWLHESGASNYCHTPGVEDFGVHYIPGEDIAGQLSEWLQIAKGTGWLPCYLQGGWVEKMHTFLSRYQLGSQVCDPSNSLGNSFYNSMVTTFQWVSGGCLDSNGGFLIDTPTDSSCP